MCWNMLNKHATIRGVKCSKNLKQSAAAASCSLLTKAAVVQARAAKQAFGHHRAGVYQQ